MFFQIFTSSAQEINISQVHLQDPLPELDSFGIVDYEIISIETNDLFNLINSSSDFTLNKNFGDTLTVDFIKSNVIELTPNRLELSNNVYVEMENKFSFIYLNADSSIHSSVHSAPDDFYLRYSRDSSIFLIRNLEDYGISRYGKSFFVFTSINKTSGSSANDCTYGSNHEGLYYLEFAIGCDYKFVELANEGYDGPLTAFEKAEWEMELYLNDANIVYFNHFESLIFKPIYSFVPTEADNFSKTDMNTYLTSVRNFWENEKRSCIQKDLSHQFSGHDLEADGKAVFNSVCHSNGIENDYGGLTEHKNMLPHEFYRVAHEIGHEFGLNHLDDVSECSSKCGELENNVADLMCQNESNLSYPVSPEDVKIVKIQFETIKNKISGTSDCVDANFSEQSGINCITSMTGWPLQVEVQLECENDNSPVLYNFTFHNNDVAKSIVFGIHYAEDVITFEDFDFGHYSPTASGDDLVIESYSMPFAANESKTFSFKGTVLSNGPSIKDYFFVNAYKNGIGSQTWESIDFFIDFKGAEILPGNNNISELITNNNNPIYDSDQGEKVIIQLDGKLTIDDDFVMSEESEIWMTGASEIVVESGSKLTLDHNILSACSTMWKGIKVEDGGSLEIANSTISDAQYAIYAEDGASINVTYTDLIDNYISVYNPVGSKGYFNIFIYHDNNINTEKGLLPAYDGQSPSPGATPFTGIEVNKLLHFNLGQKGEFPNTFKNLYYGIVLKETSFNLSRIYFENIASVAIDASNIYGKFRSGKLSNSSLTAVFNNCRTAINSYNYELDISKSIFQNVDYGIRIPGGFNKAIKISKNLINSNKSAIDVKNFHYTSFELSYNTILNAGILGEPAVNIGNTMSYIEIGDNGIFQNSIISTDGHGILVNGGDNFNIYENNLVFGGNVSDNHSLVSLRGCPYSAVNCNAIYGQISNNESEQLKGIEIHNSSTTEISCNQLYNNTIGVNVFGNCPNSDIRGNEYINGYTGLYYGLYPNLEDGNTGPQIHNGNLFSTPQGYGSTYGAVNLQSIPDLTLLSQYKVNTNENEDLLPEFSATDDEDNEWFEDDLEGVLTYSCESTEGQSCENGIGNPGIIYKLKNDSINLLYRYSDIDFIIYKQELNWSLKYDLYENIVRISDQSVDSLYTNFKSAFDTLNSHPLYRASSFLKSSIGLTDSVYMQTMDSLILMDSLIITFMDSTLVDSLINARQHLLLSFENTVNNMDSLCSEALVATKDNLTYELSNFNTLDTQNLIPESSFYYVISFINNSLDSIEYLNASDSTLLISIANLCPLEGGRAVYMARGMLEFDDYNENEICDTIYIRSQQKKEEWVTSIGKLVVRPNPNSGRFAITLPNNSLYHLSVFNISGNMIREQNNASSEVEIEIKENGIYIVFALDVITGKKYMSKVVVAKK